MRRAEKEDLWRQVMECANLGTLSNFQKLPEKN
jgi:hypothetical protein